MARILRWLTFVGLLVGIALGSRVALVIALLFVYLLLESVLADLPFVEAEAGVVERLRQLLHKDDR